ncbi:MAG TPA: ABC transporter permease, partial [Gemmatimonadales bacterium]
MKWWRKAVRRLRLLTAPRAVERDMDDEIRFHLLEATRELERTGLSPVAARRSARLSFGGVEATKEHARDARGGRVLSDLVADVRYAVLRTVRAPLHSGSVVILLGVAIAGVGLSMALARAYLLRPLPFPAPERLVSVLTAPTRAPLPNPPDLRAVDWTSAARLFEGTVAWDLDGFTLVGNGPPEYVDGSWVSPGFFELLAVRPALGRAFLPSEYVPGSTVALISDGLWRRRFGADSRVVGSTVRAHSTDRPDEDALITIVGVLPPADWQLHRFTDMLRPLGTPRMFSLARLPAGLTPTAAAARLTAVVREQVAVGDSSWRMSLVSTQDEHVYQIRPVLHVLLAAALLLLLLAQASAGALLLARTTARIGELGVRRALGATRGRLARQLAAEAALLGALGFALGVGLTPVLAGFLTRGMESFGEVTVPGGVDSVGLDPLVVLAVFIVTAVPFGFLALLPLQSLAAREGTHALSRITPPRGATRMRRLLATVQVVVAVALLSQGALLLQSVRAMLRVDLGFEPEGLLKAHVLLPRTTYPDGDARRLAMTRILDRIRQVPGVVDAASGHPHPFRPAPFLAVECDGCDPGAGRPLAVPTTVTPGYFATMRIPLVTGRLFDQRDLPDGEPVTVVSRALATRLWSTGDAVGRRLRLGNVDSPGPWLTVIGVVGEVRKTYSDSLYPDLYRPFAQAPRAYAALLVRTGGDPLPLQDQIRLAVAAEDESLALSDVEPMRSLLSARRGRPGILAAFVGGVAVVAFGLTIFGLHAVVGYLVRLRRREFAVRVALGAKPGQIVYAVLAEARPMLGLGLAGGVALAWATVGLSRAFIVGISPNDPMTYAGV